MTGRQNAHENPLVGVRSLSILQAASATTGAVVVFFVDLNGRLALSALLLATACGLLVSQFVLGRQGDLLRALMVAPIGIGALLIDPRVFAVVAIALAINLQWILKRRHFRWFVPVVLASDIAVCVVAALVDSPQWQLINAGLAVMIPTHILINTRVRNRAEQKERDLNQVLQTAGITVYETDLESRRYSMLTGPLLEQTGWTYDEWEAKGDALIHPDDREHFWIDPQEFSDDTLLDRTARFRRPNGEYMWLRDVSRLVVDVDGRRRILGLLADVSESQIELMRMRRRALVDALTGVSNRFALLDVLEDRLSANRDGDARFALLVIDVNRFKEINDTLGHAFGDETLRAIAERLDATMRPGDEIGRIGGDEFAVVARDVGSHEQATAVAERIASAAGEPLELASVRLNMSVSMSVETNCDSRPNRLVSHKSLPFSQTKASASKARSKFADQTCSQSILIASKPPTNRLTTVGFKPATSLFVKTDTTESWGGSRSTSSKAAVTNFRLWKSKQLYWTTSRSKNAPSLVCLMKLGASRLPWQSCCTKDSNWSCKIYAIGVMAVFQNTKCPSSFWSSIRFRVTRWARSPSLQLPASFDGILTFS